MAGVRSIRQHSSEDMAGLGEFTDTAEPVAVVLRPDGSVDVYGYVAVIDQSDDPRPRPADGGEAARSAGEQDRKSHDVAAPITSPSQNGHTRRIMTDTIEDRWFVVVIREPDGRLHGLSRRQPGPDGQPFAGPWGALTEDEAAGLADAYNADEREGGTAGAVELFRYDRDSKWPGEFV
jgi:hypothetical protein